MLEFRSGSSTEISVDLIADEHVCLALRHGCEEPESVEVRIDTGLVMQWHRPHELGPGEGLGLAPGLYCHHTHELSDAQHSFELTAVCGGTPTSDSVNASTTAPGFRIAALRANRSWYGPGDTIVLELDAQADDLRVTVDFSELDPGYTPESETVTDLGGGLYTIEYTAPFQCAGNAVLCDTYVNSSTCNPQPGCTWVGASPTVGDCVGSRECAPFEKPDCSVADGCTWLGVEEAAVTVTVSDGSLTKERVLSTRYLPKGFPRTSLPTGRFSPMDAPSRAIDQTTQITDVTIGERPDPPAPSADDPTLFDESPEGIDGARSIVIEFLSGGFTLLGGSMELGDGVLVEMWDPDANGHFADRFEITSVDCNPGTGVCEYEATGHLVEEPHDVEPGDPLGDIQVRVVLTSGNASPFSSTTVMGCGCEPGVTIIEGTIDYVFEECEPDFSADLDDSPQFYPSTCTFRSRPARHIMVEVVALGTMQGQVLARDRAFATKQGGFYLILPDTAAELVHEIRVWSVTPKSPGSRIAVGAWQGGTVSKVGDMTDDPADYEVHSATLTSFIPQNEGAAHGEGILMSLGSLEIQHSEGQEDMSWATHIIDEATRGIDYFASFVDVKKMHWMNIAWQSDEVGLQGAERANRNHFGVHPAFIFILPESTDSFIVLHELAHHFHREYLRNDGDYGRFREPMAHTNAGMARTATFYGEWMTSTTSYKADRESLDFNGHNKDGTIVLSDLQFFPDHASYVDCDNRPSCCNPEATETEGNTVAKPLCVLGSQGYIWRTFWDLHDGTSTEPWAPPAVSSSFDQVDGGAASTPPNHKLMDVLFGYLGGKKQPENTNYEDRGLESVDPADVLDGMMCRGHMTLQQAEVLLHDVMNYEYDFDPANPQCL